MLSTLWLAATVALTAGSEWPAGSPVEVVFPDYGEAVREFEADPPAWNRTLVNVGWGTGRGAPERRDGWYRKHWLWIDSVDRSGSTATNDFLEHRGIFRDWSGPNEYQETLHFREEGALGLLVEHGGLVRDRQNRPVLHPKFNLGSAAWSKRADYDVYLASHTAPRWHAISNYDWVQSPLFGDGLSQDNIGLALNGEGSTADIDDRKFRQHLERTGRLGRYRERGKSIRDDLQQRLAPKLRGLSSLAAAARRRQDRVWREYWRFQNLANLYAFSRSYRDAKAVARSQGRAFDVHGNQAGWVFGFDPYQVVLSDFVDSLWMESSGFLEYDLVEHDWTNAWGAFRFQLADALAGDTKPVLAMSSVRTRTPDRLAAAWAEASAGGGVMMLNTEFDPEGSPARQTSDAFLEFRDRHRALFEREGRRRYAQVALLYSLPTAFYDQSVRQPDSALMRNLGGTTRALEEGHVPFDVVILDDPEFRKERLTLADLQRYRVVIAPSVGVLSESQRDMLASYLTGGGTLVVVGGLGERDGRGRERKASVLATLREAGKVIRPIEGEGFGPARTKRTPRIEAGWRRFAEAVRRAVGKPLIEGALPSRLWVKTWRHGDDLLSFQFVNTDLDPQEGRARPTAATRLSLALPEGFEAQEARWLVPGQPERDLPLEVDHARATLEIPRVEVYGVLVLGPRGGERRESLLRRARRHLLRVRHAGAGQAGLEDRIAVVEARLRDGDVDAYARAAQGLLETVAAEREAAYLDFAGSLGKLPPHTAWAFDFGAEKSPPGWTPVAPGDTYSPRKGWGWLSSSDRSSPTPEDRHYVTSRNHQRDTDAILPGHYGPWPHVASLPTVARRVLWSGRQQRFRADVPDGHYRVTLLETYPSGFYWGRLVSGAAAVGSRPVLFDTPLEPGALERRSFDAQATGGSLEFTLGAATGWGVATLVIERLDAQDVRGLGPEIAGAIRSWEISARHPNPEWFPLEEIAPPPAAVLEGATGGEWTPVSAAIEGFPWVDLGDASRSDTGDVVYARAVINDPEVARRLLEFGSTSSARAWWNGDLVASLQNVKGLMRAEGRAEVILKPGRNVLVLALERFWERRWIFYASLVKP